MNKFYTDKELENLFGRRPTGAISLFYPMELGWVCPVDKHHELAWSEFKDHLWCWQCKMDYFSLLCPKKMNPFTTEDILKKETEMVKDLMDRWTLEKYKSFKAHADHSDG